MAPEIYMQKAIEVAKQSEQEGGVAIGAVLVNDDTGGVLRQECAELFKGYVNWTPPQKNSGEAK